MLTLAPNTLELIEPLSTFGSLNIFDYSGLDLTNKGQQEIIKLSILKDKVYQIYKYHIQKSPLINSTRERLENGDYIDSDAENITIEHLNKAIMCNISEYTKWITLFVKDLPGFDRFDLTDFTQMISNCSLLSMAIHLNEFFINGESYQITPNGYQLSRSRMNAGFGTFITSLFFLINEKTKKLDLSHNEKAIFYPFSIFSSKSKQLNSNLFIFKLYFLLN